MAVSASGTSASCSVSLEVHIVADTFNVMLYQHLSAPALGITTHPHVKPRCALHLACKTSLRFVQGSTARSAPGMQGRLLLYWAWHCALQHEQSPEAPFCLQLPVPYGLRPGCPAGQRHLLDAPLGAAHGPLRPHHPHLWAQPAGTDEPPGSALHQRRPHRRGRAQHRCAGAVRVSLPQVR